MSMKHRLDTRVVIDRLYSTTPSSSLMKPFTPATSDDQNWPGVYTAAFALQSSSQDCGSLGFRGIDNDLNHLIASVMESHRDCGEDDSDSTSLKDNDDRSSSASDKWETFSEVSQKTDTMDYDFFPAILTTIWTVPMSLTFQMMILNGSTILFLIWYATIS